MTEAIEHYRPGKSHMQACLDDHKGTSFYNTHKNGNGEIVLVRIELDAGGYTKAGKYYGIGAPLFQVMIEPALATHEEVQNGIFELRGSNENGRASRAALRKELKKLYPNMKIRP